MATYTDNNNTVSLSSLQGLPGPGGSTGLGGATGPTGVAGLQGPSGTPNLLRTDIAFSGASNSSCREVKEGKLQWVGSCAFNLQADLITSASTEVKVLSRAFSGADAGENVEVGFVLNCDKPATNGETILASGTAMISGSGLERDSTIVQLTLSANTFTNQLDNVSLWAFIKPTIPEMNDVTTYLTNLTDPDTGVAIYSSAQITRYIEATYIYPYRMTTSNLWLMLKNNYNTINKYIDTNTQNTYLAQEIAEAAYFANVDGGPIQYHEEATGVLNVYYLQIQ
jgi:hypothetical protein